jgi:hypothetical protein
MTNIERRLEKAEQSLAPQGTFVACLITLEAYNKARFDIEHVSTLSTTSQVQGSAAHVPIPTGGSRELQRKRSAHTKRPWFSGSSPCRRRDGPIG